MRRSAVDFPGAQEAGGEFGEDAAVGLDGDAQRGQPGGGDEAGEEFVVQRHDADMAAGVAVASAAAEKLAVDGAVSWNSVSRCSS